MKTKLILLTLLATLCLTQAQTVTIALRTAVNGVGRTNSFAFTPLHIAGLTNSFREANHARTNRVPPLAAMTLGEFLEQVHVDAVSRSIKEWAKRGADLEAQASGVALSQLPPLLAENWGSLTDAQKAAVTNTFNLLRTLQQ